MATNEQVRKAVEDAIVEGLEVARGDWTAILENGKEVPFSPGIGTFEVEIYDEENGEERSVRLRVSVQMV